MTEPPNLHKYDWVVVNSSAGKDSQASLDVIVQLADAQAYPRAKIVVAHADLDRAEWPGTKELAAEHAAHYGLRFEVERRPQGDLLQQVEERGMWPSSKQRYCTSDQKRGQIARLFTRLAGETRKSRGSDQRQKGACGHKRDVEKDLPKHVSRRRRSTKSRRAAKVVSARKVRILQIFGFRAEESPAVRGKMKRFEVDTRLTNGRRHVDRWLPIHRWKLAEVWERCRQAGTRIHWAYARGMKRLSCRFCIFAPRSQLVIAASQPENKELLTQYVQLEVKIDHKFRQNQSIAEVAAAVEAGERADPDADDGCWGM